VIRIALLLWAALMLAMPATAQVGVAPPSGFIVAATQGQTSVTGTTSETNLAALKIPGGVLGKNGHVEIKALWSFTNSANTKTLWVRMSSTAGVTGQPSGFAQVTTTATAQTLSVFRNMNATNSQRAYGGGQTTAPFGSGAGADTTATSDTTQDTYINLDGTLALGTETITLVHAYAVVFPAN